MKQRINEHESGWISVELELSISEIDQLQDCLQRMKTGELGHFHLRENQWQLPKGLADVEFSVKEDPESEGGSMTVS